MARAEFLKRVSAVRRDLGNLLFHWTRSAEADLPAPVQGTIPRIPAGEVLRKILAEGILRGESTFIKGSYKCVCFTEAPISEVASLFRLSELVPDDERPRYEPYGVAVTKEWLFRQGGRSVIYQPDSDYRLLPSALKWRHSRYEPDRGIDFTWEREWRIRTSELRLDPKSCLVIVPSADEAFELMYSHAELKPASYDDQGFPDDLYHEPRWMVLSLDFFGISWPT